MAIVIGIIQFIIIGIVCIYEYKRRSSSIFLWATLFVMFGTMHLFISITGDEQYSSEVLNKAGLLAVLFCICYLQGRVIFSKNTQKNIEFFRWDFIKDKMKSEHNIVNSFFYIYMGVFVIKLLLYIRYAGNVLSTSWATGRNYSASMNYINSGQIIGIVFFAMSGLVAVLWLRGETVKFWVAVSLTIINVIITRNRIEVLPFFCCVIGLYLWKSQRLSLKTMIMALLGAVMVVYIVYGLRVFRHYGTLGDFLANSSAQEFFLKINNYIKTGNGELSLLRVMYYFIDNNNNFKDFGKLHSYIRMLLVFIPTKFSLGIKPYDFAIMMGQAYGMGPGESTHPTLFGDCYANAGMFGFLLGYFWAAYASFIDRITLMYKRTETMIMAYILNAVVYTIIGRGSIYNGFWYVAYGMPVLFIFEFCTSRFRLGIRYF